MADPETPLRVAILGARGIGKVHARIFNALGCAVYAVLGSRDETARQAAEALREAHGIEARPFADLEALLATRPDAISICTPPALHFEQMMAAFTKGIPVLCEKPLLWAEGMTHDRLRNELGRLALNRYRRLHVNTSNASFIDAVADWLPPRDGITTFDFHFHTRGRNKGKAIAMDLLPHALSLLLRLKPRAALEDFTETVEDFAYDCAFRLGDVQVHFDLRSNPVGEKAFGFAVNDQAFSRIQEGQGESYRVYLAHEPSGERIPMRDPFEVYIEEFIRFVRAKGSRKQDRFEEAAANLSLMADILLGPAA